MSDETIAAALTPEQWAAVTQGEAVSHNDVAMRHGGDCLTLWAGDVETAEPPDALMVCKGERHALAALALHGQPFGFHRDHLSILRHAIAVANRRDVTGLARDLQEIADRIAALLPPEGT